MHRSNHNLIHKRTQVSLSVTFLGSVEEFQDGNKCFKPFLYYPNCGLAPWHEEKKSWSFADLNHAEPQKPSAISGWHSMRRLELSEPEWVMSVQKKRWLRGDLSVVFGYLLGSVKEQEITRTSWVRGNTEWDIQKKLLTAIITREFTESSPSDTIKTWHNHTQNPQANSEYSIALSRSLN